MSDILCVYENLLEHNEWCEKKVLMEIAEWIVEKSNTDIKLDLTKYSKQRTLSYLPPLSPTLKHLILPPNPYLKELPPLPEGLETLICAGSLFLTKLPPLPKSLRHLNISKTKITHLNIRDLPNLEYLNMSELNVGTETIYFPSSLKYLDIRKTNMGKFDNFPSSLTYLDCGYTPMGELPSLPTGLKTLKCDRVRLDALPLLPASLLHVDLCYTKIKEIPALPPQLEYFDMSYTEIKEIPPLPDSLKYFDMHHTTSVRDLPALPPTLTYLNISDTDIRYLPPTLPPTLETFKFTDMYFLTPPIPDVSYIKDCRSSYIEQTYKLIKHTKISDIEDIFGYGGRNELDHEYEFRASINSEYTVTDADDYLQYWEPKYNLRFFYDTKESVHVMTIKFDSVNYKEVNTFLAKYKFLFRHQKTPTTFADTESPQ
jgi:hypothetical protein